MVDTTRIAEIIPHYFAMLIAIFIVLAGIRITVGDLGFWIELLIVLVVAFVYPPVVRRLGVAPTSWQKEEE